MPRFLIVAGLVCVSVAGCDDRTVDGPPVLRVGRDECAGCGMLIAEDRCAAACLVERDGVREPMVFDDLGCLLDYERDLPAGARVVSRFARDYHARAWLSCDAATFLWTGDGVHTPMGSGIIAFADRAAAEQAHAAHAGEVIAWPEVVTRRTRHMHEQFGAPRATS